jgi:hypothetical protein
VVNSSPYSAFGDVRRGGDLPHTPFFQVAHPKDTTLAGGQFLNGDKQGSMLSAKIVAIRERQRRSVPHRIGLPFLLLPASARASDMHRAVFRDGMQVGRHTLLLSKPRKGAEQTEEGILGNIVGIVRVLHRAASGGKNIPTMALNEDPPGFRISNNRTVNQIAVGRLLG